MGWADTWSDIAEGGSQRWKVTDENSHKTALSHMQRYLPSSEYGSSILCPLAGDDPMVHLLWDQGYSVTAMDLVPLALQRMRQQFKGEWTKEEEKDGNNAVIWKHESGRATQYQGDALQKRPELKNSFDAVYDKDSFGALPINLREAYCARLADYTKPDGFVYIEVKVSNQHETAKDNGPPFSLQKEDLMDPRWYGASFEHTEGLGFVYPVLMPNVRQTGHILKRK